MIQQAIFAILAGDAGVAALVGDRIYPQIIPQQNFDEATFQPSVVYSTLAADRQQTLCGTSPTVATSVRLDCYARTYAVARAVAEAVRAALIDYRGTVAEVYISTVNFDTEFDLLEGEPGLHRVVFNCTAWHRTSI